MRPAARKASTYWRTTSPCPFCQGMCPTLKALARGQVRTLVADGQVDDPRLDEAVEDALRQRAQVDVLYDAVARRGVEGLAALLRFRR